MFTKLTLLAIGLVSALGASTNYASEVLPKVQSYYTPKLTAYPHLSVNKGKINQAMASAKCNMPPARKVLIMSMAMLETRDLEQNSRDKTKDNNGLAANASLWNLNYDMIQMLGYGKHPTALNSNLGDAVCIISKGIDMWGVERLLAFVRGGRDGFYTLTAWGAQEYIKVIASIMHAIDQDSRLMQDDRRVELWLKHV